MTGYPEWVAKADKTAWAKRVEGTWVELKFPEDAMKTANGVVTEWKTGDTSAGLVPLIAAAIMAERKRCVDICEAEREWGGTIPDAQDRIASGQGPREIL